MKLTESYAFNADIKEIYCLTWDYYPYISPRSHIGYSEVILMMQTSQKTIHLFVLRLERFNGLRPIAL